MTIIDHQIIAKNRRNDKDEVNDILNDDDQSIIIIQE